MQLEDYSYAHRHIGNGVSSTIEVINTSVEKLKMRMCDVNAFLSPTHIRGLVPGMVYIRKIVKAPISGNVSYRGLYKDDYDAGDTDTATVVYSITIEKIIEKGGVILKDYNLMIGMVDVNFDEYTPIDSTPTSYLVYYNPPDITSKEAWVMLNRVPLRIPTMVTDFVNSGIGICDQSLGVSGSHKIISEGYPYYTEAEIVFGRSCDTDYKIGTTHESISNLYELTDKLVNEEGITDAAKNRAVNASATATVESEMTDGKLITNNGKYANLLASQALAAYHGNKKAKT